MAKFDIEPQRGLTGPADETYTARRGKSRNKAMKQAKEAKAQKKKFSGFEGGIDDEPGPPGPGKTPESTQDV